jgi:hypothetical protein
MNFFVEFFFNFFFFSILAIFLRNIFAPKNYFAEAGVRPIYGGMLESEKYGTSVHPLSICLNT